MATSTTNLMSVISKEKNLDSFKKRMEDEYVETDVCKMLRNLCFEKGFEISQVMTLTGIAKSTIYDIFNGKKTPNRDKVLAILIAMNCSLDETNNFLKRTQYAAIDERNKRDAIIYFCVNNGFDIQKTNETLYDEGFEILG